MTQTPRAQALLQKVRDVIAAESNKRFGDDFDAGRLLALMPIEEELEVKVQAGQDLSVGEEAIYTAMVERG